MPLAARTSTADRLIDAFLELAADRGLEGATTREIAEAAGVNEVTLFRHFGSKEALAKETFRRRMPKLVEALEPVDASSREGALSSVSARVRKVRDLLAANAELLELGISMTRRRPDLAASVRELPLSAPRTIASVLDEVRPHLRGDVDVEAAALSLTGLVVLTLLWQRRGFLRLAPGRWDALIDGAVRPLFKEVKE